MIEENNVEKIQEILPSDERNKNSFLYIFLFHLNDKSDGLCSISLSRNLCQMKVFEIEKSKKNLTKKKKLQNLGIDINTKVFFYREQKNLVFFTTKKGGVQPIIWSLDPRIFKHSSGIRQ